MKRIALVTLYDSDNYGAMLQAYALYRSIEKNGCRCQIVQHDRFNSTCIIPKDQKHIRTDELVKRVLHLVRHPVYCVRTILLSDREKQIKENQKACAAFRETFFPNLTPHFYGSYESIVNDPPICDGLVCGSDQIWNPRRFSGAAPFFLDFGDEAITRIAYGPSLATSKIPEHMADQYRQWIEKLDYVSVRETSGVRAITESCGIVPKCVLDPTFLLERTEWDALAISDEDRKKKFIFCYFLGKEHFIAALKAIKKLAKKLDAEIVVLPAGRHNVPKSIAAEDVKYGPRAFLKYMRDAEYVVTDSFHGTAFSIIYRKQFSVFKTAVNTEVREKFVRMEEILDSFGLQSRVFTEKEDCITAQIDYSEAEKRIRARILESESFLISALDSVREGNAVPYKEARLATEDECTGCTACAAACPSEAISMQQNALGFWHPHVDADKCVQCGVCYGKCPVLHPLDTQDTSNASYAAIYAGDKEVRTAGSSGNAFGLLVDLFRQNDTRAVVYGAAFEPDCYSVSCRSTEEVSLKQLQKSKYLESNMGDAIRRIRADLNAGKKVLFCGTPCQVIGVRSVLGHREGLLLCDLICHGTASAAWYEKYLRTLEKTYGSKAIFVDFRSKLVGWTPYCTDIRFENGKEYIKTVFADPYLTDFFKNNHLRKNCYNCNRVMSSQADLTLGDYWAVRVYQNVENTNEGISVVRAQTKLGIEYLEKLKATPQTFVKELSDKEVSRTYVNRKRTIPGSSETYPDVFPMHPKRSVKGWIRFFYYEIYVKHIKYRVREKR